MRFRIYIYIRNSNEKSMFLIVSGSFDENVKVTYIYIYVYILCRDIFNNFPPSFLSDVFEVYIYQKSRGNVYIYTCNLDMF